MPRTRRLLVIKASGTADCSSDKWEISFATGPFLFLLLWSTQVAFAIEAWRRRHNADLRRWMDVVGEFETLCALANYAFENPEYPFAEILEGEIRLDGQELRHPLLPRSQCIANSISLGTELQLMMVSGSNMSGKSTLLRTVGINIVLAQCGAPVCARRLKCSRMTIGATLRVTDSLQSGKSRFYAEIRRLKDMMLLAEEGVPVLFLLDEILHGTNSHDRVIGAEAVIRGLVERNAIGLVTTHDLALTGVADALAPLAANVHFEDHLENGEMKFDYLLRNGVIHKSNALEFMRAVGLKV
jgi:DNA mismatch repair ATPase MutS